GRVGDQAVLGDADVEADDVSVLGAILARDAVDDHLVRRDADGRRKALVALRGRHGLVRADVVLRDAVELGHRDARLEPLLEERQRAGDDGSRPGHQLDLTRALPDDHAEASTCWSASSISAQTSSIVRSAWSGTSRPVTR